MQAEGLAALAPASPALGALSLGALLVLGRVPEPRVVAVATASLALSLAGTLGAAVSWVQGGATPRALGLGHWFQAGAYEFEVVLLVDRISVVCSSLAALLLLATCRFSTRYLHREPGFGRFFLLMLLFAAGMQLLVLGGSLDVLFAGWEIVGLTSVLLVGFFHERKGPVRAAIRVLVTYRLCDIGLLLAALLLHRSARTTAFLAIPPGSTRGAVGLGVGAGVLLAAMGKSAQFPVGGWLPRAMEGPTASSAVFYGGLSVHAGVFLLLRMAPFYEHLLAVRGGLVLIGAVTAVTASLSGQVSPDAKSSLAYSTIAQVGLMLIECGLGWTSLALGHLVAHSLLRYYQFLRTPSALQDALTRRSALRAASEGEGQGAWRALGLDARRFLYRLAIERFEVEVSLRRWLLRPALALSARLDALERRLTGEGQDSAALAPGRPPVRPGGEP